jgi:hypothetical protein
LSRIPGFFIKSDFSGYVTLNGTKITFFPGWGNSGH